MQKEHGKSYVGSAKNLSIRFKQYFNYNHLTAPKRNMAIYKAILKYGYAEFRLEILEYCDPQELLKKEQFYMDKFNPEYNILKFAGSSLGYVFSEASRAKMSISHIGIQAGEKNPMFGVRKTHSKEIRALITLAKLGKSFLSDTVKAKMSKERGTAIKVIDLKTNETSVYTSIKKAAEAMGVAQPSISQRLSKTQGSFTMKKRYLVEKVNESSDQK